MSVYQYNIMYMVYKYTLEVSWNGGRLCRSLNAELKPRFNKASLRSEDSVGRRECHFAWERGVVTPHRM